MPARRASAAAATVPPIYAAVGIAAALAASGALLYVLLRGARGVGADVGGGAVNFASGLVLGVGDGVGIPRTDAARCADCIARGDLWGASKYCAAGTLISALPGLIRG